MAATVQIISHHGATGATENVVSAGTTRFKVADDATVDANNPIPIPPSGTNYSYIKQLRLKATTTPSNTINNIKFYTDGDGSTLGTGCGIVGKTYAFASYVNPATQGTTALTAVTDIFTYTSGAPLAVSGSINNPSTGGFGDLVALQFTVASTASPGTTGGETMTFSYDES